MNSLFKAAIAALLLTVALAGHDNQPPTHKADTGVRCEYARHIDKVDRNSGYAITHNIIANGGEEDTLTVALEDCK